MVEPGQEITLEDGEQIQVPNPQKELEKLEVLIDQRMKELNSANQQVNALLESNRKLIQYKKEAVIYQDAFNRSGFDMSPCGGCSLPVICIPDGLPMCEDCINAEAKKTGQRP